MAKILCIEDEEFIREDIVEILEEGGHTLFQAGDGQEGLQVILEEKPDLVISDINMPNMNGAQLLVKLRKAHPQFDDMPFIFLTAFADRNDVLKGTKLGADDYLTKPVDFEMLEAKVDQHLRHVSRIKKKEKRVSPGRSKVLTEAESSQITSNRLHSIKNIHNVKIVILGKRDVELKVFTDFMYKNNFNDFLHQDESKYLNEMVDFPNHFVFLWDYSYDRHQAFNAKMTKLPNNGIVVGVVPENIDNKINYSAIESIGNVLKLPVTPRSVNQKLVEFVQKRLASL